MPNPNGQDAGEEKPLRTIEILLPGHRGPYAVNDFRRIRSRMEEQEIVDYLCRDACPFIRYRGGTVVLRLPSDASRDPESERITVQAYRDMLVEWSRDAWSSALRLVPKGVGLIIFGVAVLFAVYFLASNQEGTVPGVIGSVLQVGAWVALWTAISALCFEATTFWHRSSTLYRLSRSPFRFQYADVDPHERFVPNEYSPAEEVANHALPPR